MPRARPREEKYTFRSSRFTILMERGLGEPPVRDTPLCAVENSPQVCCQTRTCSEKARIYVDQLLSPASLLCLPASFIFLFHFRARISRRVVRTLHAGKLLVIAMHNIRNFSSNDLYGKEPGLNADARDSRE